MPAFLCSVTGLFAGLLMNSFGRSETNRILDDDVLQFLGVNARPEKASKLREFRRAQSVYALPFGHGSSSKKSSKSNSEWAPDDYVGRNATPLRRASTFGYYVVRAVIGREEPDPSS